MTFAEELKRCLAKGLTMQYIENHRSYTWRSLPEPVLWWKRTHGSRTDEMQGLDAMNRYALRASTRKGDL